MHMSALAWLSSLVCTVVFLGPTYGLIELQLGCERGPFRKDEKMSMSYFRRRAAQSYRDARTSLAPHLEYDSLMRLGREFKARAIVARARLARLRDAVLLREEAERQELYRDSRE